MRIAICDDNQAMRTQIKDYISLYFEQKHLEYSISVFSSGEELTTEIRIFDLAFLDIEMGKIGGIESGYWLKEQNPNIVLFIITAFDNYLDDAFDLNVFRYLQKPIQKNRLYKSLDAALERNRKISFKSDNEIITISAQDIVCAFAQSGKTVIISDKKTYYTNYTLNFWKENLYESFFSQPHNSYLVNLNYAIRFGKNFVTLKYGNNQTVTADISQRKYYQFQREFFKVMERRK
jgi:two-component system, LytTR family, response regulator